MIGLFNARPTTRIATCMSSLTNNSLPVDFLNVYYLRGMAPDCEILPSMSSDKTSMEYFARPVVISGPSGVGKGTLINELLKRFPSSSFGFSVSHTTRPPRPGEVDGEHYHFVTKDQIQASIDNGEFIENSEVHGNIYGTSYSSVQSVMASGKICILDIDVKGSQVVKQSNLDPHSIFIAPPSMEILEGRLRGRGTESEEAIQRRLGNARAEVDYGLQRNNFDYVVVNEELQVAAGEMVEILVGVYPELRRMMDMI